MIFRAHTFAVLLFAVAVTVADEATTGTSAKDIQPTILPGPTTSPTPSTPTPSPPTKPTTTPTVPTPPPTTPSPPTKPTTTPVPTPSPTTPSTTPSPTTTTTPATTHAPAPTTPAPAPKDWVVKNANNSICIVANMVLKITVPYSTINKKNITQEFDLKNVADAHANGSCGAGVESLVLTWPNITSTFNFGENTTDHKSYSLSSIQIDILINEVTFPNHTFGNLTTLVLKHNAPLFSLPMNYSYTCAQANSLLLNSTALNATVSGHLFISNAHVQAFGNKTEPTYFTARDCASTETPDIVPIAVGLILAGLVVVVLIAYLVGRRRAQSRGYLSM